MHNTGYPAHRQSEASGIILEATGKLEMPLAAELQAKGLLMVVINSRQVHDFAHATDALAKTDAIDARLLALFGLRIKARGKTTTG